MDNQLDLLKKTEELTLKLNNTFANKTKPVYAKYPLTFMLLVLFGITFFSIGIKEIIFKISFLKEKPFLMIVIGLFILIMTGTLYKKLDK